LLRYNDVRVLNEVLADLSEHCIDVSGVGDTGKGGEE
jgi:hypothetical protein